MVRFEKSGPSFVSLHVNKSDGVTFGGTDLSEIVIGGIGGTEMPFGCKLNDNGLMVLIGTNLIKIDQFVENCEI